MTDLSIIIVNWNTKNMLMQCLNSIMDRTESGSIEIIIVDNGSTDGSQDMIRKHFPDAKLICNGENLGFAKANNIGIKNSRGRYICLVNSDIEVLDNCLDKMRDYMDRHGRIGILGPKILNPDGSTRYDCREFPNLWNTICRAAALYKVFPRSKWFSDQIMRYFPHDSILSVDSLAGCFLMARREAVEQVGLLDETYFIFAEDKDWCKRFHERGWDVVFYPYAEAVHYAGASSAASPTRFLIERLKSNLFYWAKHHGRAGKTAFAAIQFFHYLVRMAGALIGYCIRPSKRKEYREKMRSNGACVLWLVGRTVRHT